MNNDTLFTSIASLFLALSDKTRLRLLALMADGEVSVGYLADKLGESQPKVSRHLAYLRGAGIVSTRRDGKWIYYALAGQDDAAAEILGCTLRAIGNGSPGKRTVIEQRVAKPQVTADKQDTYAKTDMSEWRPAEIDIFLL